MSGAILNTLQTLHLHHHLHSFVDGKSARLNDVLQLVVGKPRFKPRKLVFVFVFSAAKLSCL